MPKKKAPSERAYEMMSPLERPSALRRIASSTISCVSFERLAMQSPP